MAHCRCRANARHSTSESVSQGAPARYSGDAGLGIGRKMTRNTVILNAALFAVLAAQPLAAQGRTVPSGQPASAGPQRLATTPSQQPSAPAPPINPSSYRIGLQDEIKITVFDEPDLSAMYRVDADGAISFPLVGHVDAAGLTLAEFQQRITSLLAA